MCIECISNDQVENLSNLPCSQASTAFNLVREVCGIASSCVKANLTQLSLFHSITLQLNPMASNKSYSGDSDALAAAAAAEKKQPWAMSDRSVTNEPKGCQNFSQVSSMEAKYHS